MSAITADDVKKLASLSGLTIKDDEVDALARELQALLGYVEQLDTVNVEGVEPTYQVTGLKNVTRSDELIDYGVSQKALLSNTPAQDGGSIKVKKVL
jgi:aspartyl-tRNA(Asn)/glutamyl-tRNA(Gln) amidotransferase subunit C